MNPEKSFNPIIKAYTKTVRRQHNSMALSLSLIGGKVVKKVP